MISGEKMALFILRTTSGREDQVLEFMSANVEKKGIPVYSIVRAHGMKGYLFVEARSRADVEQAAFGVPYARGILRDEVSIDEIAGLVEPEKQEINVIKNDIVEIISKPFVGEKAKVMRVDPEKNQVVVELLSALAPMPITLSLDNVKVIRRDSDTTIEK